METKFCKILQKTRRVTLRLNDYFSFRFSLPPHNVTPHMQTQIIQRFDSGTFTKKAYVAFWRGFHFKTWQESGWEEEWHAAKGPRPGPEPWLLQRGHSLCTWDACFTHWAEQCFGSFNLWGEKRWQCAFCVQTICTHKWTFTSLSTKLRINTQDSPLFCCLKTTVTLVLFYNSKLQSLKMLSCFISDTLK